MEALSLTFKSTVRISFSEYIDITSVGVFVPPLSLPILIQIIHFYIFSMPYMNIFEEFQNLPLT